VDTVQTSAGNPPADLGRVEADRYELRERDHAVLDDDLGD
jgi:hypothetical protein